MEFDVVDRPDNVALTRRRVLQAGGWGLALLVSGGVLRQSVGTAWAAPASRPSVLPPDLEVQIFQTAASLENVLVALYRAALELPFVQDDDVVRQFAETTLQHHSDHGVAFNDQAGALGGARQEALHLQYSQYIQDVMPTVTDAAGLIALAATLEEVATDTYIEDVSRLPDASTRTLVASVMGTESQHLGTLRVFASLIDAGVPGLVAIPTDVAALPANVGIVAAHRGYEIPNLAIPPASGAVL
ncbi:hypothetical protein BH24ACT5_BH24ACT5_20070 [soil metagenome]